MSTLKLTDDAVLMISMTELTQYVREFAKVSYALTTRGTPDSDRAAETIVEISKTLRCYCDQVIDRAKFCENDKWNLTGW